MNDDMPTRLRRARLKAGYKTLASAVRAKGWVYSTVAGHENGSEQIPLKWLELYEKEYRTPPGWLRYGSVEAKLTRPVNFTGLISSVKELPLLSLSELNKFRQIKDKKIPQSDKMTVFASADTHAPRLFGVAMNDKSMTRSVVPSLSDGTIVFIDPDVAPDPGDLVLAVVKGRAEAVIRMYGRAMKASTMQAVLAPFNEMFETLMFAPDEDNFIVGKVKHVLITL